LSHHQGYDNGKTLVGASTLLSRDFLQAVKESVTDAYSHQQLNWQFIPYGRPLGRWCQELQDFILQIHRYAKAYF